MREWRNLVDALDLGSSGAIRGGSSPPFRTFLSVTRDGLSSRELARFEGPVGSGKRRRCGALPVSFDAPIIFA